MTRNVIFHENIFPYSFSLPSDNSIALIDDSHNCDISMYDFPALSVSHAIDLTTDLVTSIVFDNAEVTDLDLRTSHRVKNKPQYLSILLLCCFHFMLYFFHTLSNAFIYFL